MLRRTFQNISTEHYFFRRVQNRRCSGDIKIVIPWIWQDCKNVWPNGAAWPAVRVWCRRGWKGVQIGGWHSVQAIDALYRQIQASNSGWLFWRFTRCHWSVGLDFCIFIFFSDVSLICMNFYYLFWIIFCTENNHPGIPFNYLRLKNVFNFIVTGKTGEYSERRFKSLRSSCQ